MAGKIRWAQAMAAWLVLLLVATSCAGDAENSGDGLHVVATTTILGDVAANVVGDHGSVTVLLPIGADPHSYQPSSQQAAEINRADLVLANGLGLEEGLSDVLEAAVADGANVIEIGPLVDPLPFSPDAPHDEHDEEDAAHDEHDEEDNDDPHFWLDPIRVAEAAKIIGGELATIDGTPDWDDRVSAYTARLLASHEEVDGIVGDIPAENRVLVTNHASLGYFADRYGFDVLGVVIPGGSTLADPSSAELAALTDAIEQSAVPAIFAETTEPRALAEAVAAGSGTEVAVVELFTGSLGEAGSGAETLIGLWETNARRVAAALS